MGTRERVVRKGHIPQVKPVKIPELTSPVVKKGLPQLRPIAIPV